MKTAPDLIHGTVVLTYDERLLRRKKLVTTEGEGFLVDLAAVTNLDDFWGFRLLDGRTIAVEPAEETLIEITGADLIRFAWHIGNRHTPCQIEPKRLLIRADHVLEGMLKGLGAQLTPVSEPFMPEGGAYGHGRTMGHSHGADRGPEAHDQSIGAGHDHASSGHDHASSGHGHEGAAFGWHDHGDGNLHYHPPARGDAAMPLPHGLAPGK